MFQGGMAKSSSNNMAMGSLNNILLISGVHLRLLVKMQFMGLVIGWVSCTFVWNNGEDSCYILLNCYIMQFVIWCHPFNFFVKVQNGGGCKHVWLIIF